MTTGAVVAEQPHTLAQLRQAAGVSQVQVAQRMGVGKARVLHIEAKYPNIHLDTLTRYIAALGGSIQFTVGNTHVHADRLVPDPEKRGTRAYLESRPGKGNLTYTPSAPTEELPLQSDQPEPGGDDTGGQVDHPDPEGDQSDSGQRQEP